MIEKSSKMEAWYHASIDHGMDLTHIDTNNGHAWGWSKSSFKSGVKIILLAASNHTLKGFMSSCLIFATDVFTASPYVRVGDQF